jgi:succinate dehydrogenase / fumarate reductase cytochrome b subunit
MQLVRNFWASQVGKKVVMAITGLIGVGFVIGHMIGNLQMFQGPEKINTYAHFLHHTVGGALWVARGVLIAAVVLHVVAAVQLTRQKQAARPGRVGYVKYQPQISSFASRSIRWGGALLLVWLVYHILHFTVRPELTSPGYSDTDVYNNVVKGFSRPLVTAFYVVAMVFLALHLFHGAWSSIRTLGLSRPTPRPTARLVAPIIAGVVALGFAAVPLAIAFGIVKPAAPESGVPPAAHQEAAQEAAMRADSASLVTSSTASREGK